MTKPTRLRQQLDEWGHLHLELDSGAEYAVSKGDTQIDPDGYVVIDSKELNKEFHCEKVEVVNEEPSHQEREP